MEKMFFILALFINFSTSFCAKKEVSKQVAKEEFKKSTVEILSSSSSSLSSFYSELAEKLQNIILKRDEKQLKEFLEAIKGTGVINEKFEGLTALSVACSWVGSEGMNPKMTNIIKMLLDYDADVNIADSVGMTPFLYAAISRNLEVANLLFAKGANIYAKGKWVIFDDVRAIVKINYAEGPGEKNSLYYINSTVPNLTFTEDYRY